METENATLFDRRKIVITGAGIEASQPLAINELTGFNIKAVRAGPGQIHVDIRDPIGQTVASSTKTIDEGVYLCTYTPTTEGLHTIFVTFKGVSLIGSPFRVKVIDKERKTSPSKPEIQDRQIAGAVISQVKGNVTLQCPDEEEPASSSTIGTEHHPPGPEDDSHNTEINPPLPPRSPHQPSKQFTDISGTIKSMSATSISDIVSTPEEKTPPWMTVPSIKPMMPRSPIPPFMTGRFSLGYIMSVLNSAEFTKGLPPAFKDKLVPCMALHASLELGKPLGVGYFGVVYQARYCTDDTGAMMVAAKGLKDPFNVNLNFKDMEEFLREAVIMKNFKHDNVLELIGVVFYKGCPFIVMPLMDNGDLKAFMEKYKTELKFNALLNFGHQLAMGMEYVSNLKIVHRDLASRNCMLNSDLVAKISDFGMARDTLRLPYIMLSKDKLLPVRWMAPELNRNMAFNTQTDVWAFGVLLWEIFTYGDYPYDEIDDLKVFDHLETGNRLTKPSMATDKLYCLMLHCWDIEPSGRPPFTQIKVTLKAEMDLVQKEPLQSQRINPAPKTDHVGKKSKSKQK